jgi:hypothetical protein
MYYVLCTMYYVLCPMSYVLCTMYYVLCTMCYVLCTVYYVLCTMYYVLYTIQCDYALSAGGVSTVGNSITVKRGLPAAFNERISLSLVSFAYFVHLWQTLEITRTLEKGFIRQCMRDARLVAKRGG